MIKMFVFYFQAYKNFGSRVTNLKRKLEDIEDNLASPPPSPSMDAPSPGNTPPEAHNVMDNRDSIDMEMSDDEENGQSEYRLRNNKIEGCSF